MFVFLSKFLPPLVYPLGLACLLLIFGLLLSRGVKWQKIIIGLALLILWLGGNRWVAWSLARSLEWRYLPPPEIPKSEVIIVLGGGTHSALPPRPTVEVNNAGDRVIDAYWLYQQGKAEHILLSGGLIEWLYPGDQPAEDMATLLEMMGVPKESIWMDTTSRNTYENAVKCWSMLNEKNIRQIILVTSAMHMPRSVALFEKQGFQVIPAPTDYVVTEAGWEALTRLNLPAQFIYLIPNADNLALTSRSLKEYLGLFIYQFKGWL